MATATKISLSPTTAGIFHVPDINLESCRTVSELLQENHDRYHMYFNDNGFHNHMVHHLLSIFALGANPVEIQKAFENNTNYQRPLNPDRSVEDMSNTKTFTEYLGQQKYYHDYEVYFAKEIEAKGWEAVLNEHVFARDEHSEQMFSRLFEGFLHPLLHLGFGIEFRQPAIIAEALAEAATHNDGWIGTFIRETEKKAREVPSSKTLVELLHECRASESLRNAVEYDARIQARGWSFEQAADEITALAAQWSVKPEELEFKTAEMINSAAYMMGGSQHPPKHVKMEFIYMHCVNASIFFSTFARDQWLSIENKCRLLEAKGRMDLVLYVARGGPEILIDEITNYRPKHPEDDWKDIIKRVDKFQDDGHASKLVRALNHGQLACKPYENAAGEAFPIKGNMWLSLGLMAIDSVEAAGPVWIRNAGFDEAWEKVPNAALL